MALTLGTILQDAKIDPAEAIVIRHAYVKLHEDGNRGIQPDSTHEDILNYTRYYGAGPGTFPAVPPKYWIVFTKEGGAQARLWWVIENRGELENEFSLRKFDILETDHMAELRDRLVIRWSAPRAWWVHGRTAERYAVDMIADRETVPFPGFDRLILSHLQLQAVMREPRYASWRTALASVVGIYLITDTRDGRQYVGKADGLENISQRWSAYARDGHGGNVELKGRNPFTFQFSLLRVFDPSTPKREIDAAETHFKLALGTRRHGLNRN